MRAFVIVEIEEGATIVELNTGQSPEDAAARRGGVLLEPEPFTTYDEAVSALEEWPISEGDERE